ncbi:MAG: VWA domain-containing protein [Pseudomonadota bacterium]
MLQLGKDEQKCWRHTSFAQDEDGAILPLTIILFLVLVGTLGLGVDIMRHEMIRAEMQDSLDRGLLAAADLDQTLDPELTVKEYFRTAKWAGSAVTPTVRINENTIRSRRISAQATGSFKTSFMKLAGVSKLGLTASAVAQERRKNLEISLVLDISGTMRWCENNSSNCPDGNRIEKLIPAAQQFIDRLLDDTNADYTSISIIPYAGQVNPGTHLFETVGGVRSYEHYGNSCTELQTIDFTYSGLPARGSYDQVPHFHNWNIDNTWMEWGWCPSDDVAITPMSNDATELKTAIEKLRYNLHDGTGTNNAMKWALALLDPTSNTALQPLIEDEDFLDRPDAFNASETLKFIVLMTDGQITGQIRPTDPWNEENATRELRRQGSDAYETATGTGTAVKQFEAMCDMARDNGVVVYTIAYLAPSKAQLQMRECAYKQATHFYNIQDLDVSYAFNDIITTINKIKLVR